ncbi:MAG: thioesterase [Desulfovibrionaceae bacterium CG1_02_65_16]|nr:MAG: thioesterase [Desulfovibrionaceae bacterium CG1_02_65_16]
MDIRTHELIDGELCGAPVELEEGRSVVRLKTLARMMADASGLVHGGFVFGLADYAAMLAVNHPNVVLGASECRFLKPVRAGEELLATAKSEAPQGRKRLVRVEVASGGENVFTGVFTCFVTDTHVLSGQ